MYRGRVSTATILAFLFIAVFGALVFGVFAAIAPWFVVVALVILLVLTTIVWVAPMAALVVTLALSLGLIHPALLPAIPVAGGTAQASDLSLIFLVVAMVARQWSSVRATYMANKQYCIAIAVLAAIVALSLLSSTAFAGIRLKDSLAEARPFAYLAIGPLAIALIQTEKSFRFVLVAIVILGVMFSAGQIVQATTGVSIFGGAARVEYLETLGHKNYDVFRSLTRGINVMVFALTVAVGAYALRMIKLPIAWTIVLISGSGLVVTFGRTTWGGAGIAVIVMLVMLRMRRWPQIFAAGAIATTVGIAVLAQAKPEMLAAMSDRLLSVNREVISGQSFGWRKYEVQTVMPLLERSPVMGIGLGAPYRRAAPSDVSPEQVRYLHNGFLYVGAKLGLLGLVALSWVLIATFVAAWRLGAQRKYPPIARVAGASCAAGIMKVLSSSYTEPWLMLDSGLAFIGVCGGLAYAGLKIYGGVRVKDDQVRRNQVNDDARWAKAVAIPQPNQG